jgi:hypothetical protein
MCDTRSWELEKENTSIDKGIADKAHYLGTPGAR